MTSLSATWWVVLGAALVLGGAVWWWQRRQQTARPKTDEASAMASGMASLMPSTSQDSALAADSGQASLQTARVLNALENLAMGLLIEAFPRARVLAHVPLARFIRLPARHLRPGWMQGVSALDADLLLCDTRYRVLVVVDVRNRGENDAQRQRNDRVVQTARAAGLPVLIWQDGTLPSDPQQVREAVAALVNNPLLDAVSDTPVPTAWGVHPPAPSSQTGHGAGPALGTAASGQAGLTLPGDQPGRVVAASQREPTGLSTLERAVLKARQEQG